VARARHLALGAERVVLPDATILLHYMTHVMLRIVRGLEVHAGRMRENLELTHGAVFSQRLLLALIDQGRTRDEAYRIAQDLAGRAWAERTALRGLVEADPRCAGLDADAVFDPGHYTRHAAAIVGRLPLDSPSRTAGSCRMSYDYVIVGAGSAGCVLANRLTEDPAISVLLIEAGPPDTADFIHIPAAFSALYRSRNDWDYLTGYEHGADGRRIYLPRGKTLGGSSSMNAMIYIRGNRRDWDEWAAEGCEGWGWDAILPYFKKAEDNVRGPSELHGAGGPVRVSDSLHRNVLSQAFLDAAGAAGIPETEDFNGPSRTAWAGTSSSRATASAARPPVSYVHPGGRPPEPHGGDPRHVTRVVFEGTRAIGVEGVRLEEPLTFHAEKEVLVCAGAYNSPQLLTLSGLGPREELALLQVRPWRRSRAWASTSPTTRRPAARGSSRRTCRSRTR
jgi:hypothetical protein